MSTEVASRTADASVSVGEPAPPGRAGPQRRRITVILASVLVPVAVATILGLLTLWPSGELPGTGIVEVDAEYPTARITSTSEDACAGENEDRRPASRSGTRSHALKGPPAPGTAQPPCLGTLHGLFIVPRRDPMGGAVMLGAQRARRSRP